MSNANTLIDKKLCDILIETPGVEKYTMFDLNNIDTISELGYTCAAHTMGEEASLKIVRRCLRYKEFSEKIIHYIKRNN